MSFYGTQDGSITQDDRNKTKEQFAKANIAYSAKEYEAGHAYFQPGRPNYDELATNNSWQDLEKFINGDKRK